MSKAEGKSIVIKFTEDLVGDVVGNETAMTITGQQYKYVNGPLLDKSYTVTAVGRSLGSVLFDDDFIGGITDGVDISNDITLLSTSGGVEIDKDERSTNAGSSLSNIKVYIKYLKALNLKSILVRVNSIGAYRLTIRNSSGTIIGAPEATSTTTDEWVEFVLADTLSLIPNSVLSFTLTIVGGGTYYPFYVVGAYSSVNWQTTTGGTWGTSYSMFMGMVFEGGSAYAEIGTYISKAISVNLLGDSFKINWEHEIPLGTAITIKYGSGLEMPTEWNTILNGDILLSENLSTNLWIQYILETTNTSATPILHELWIVEATAPQDIIVLTVEQFNNFNNVEGNLTVTYDATKGNLSGTGGAVESFENVFLPTDLIQTPNPNVEEYVSVAPFEVVADLLDLEYPKAYSDMGTITVAPFEVTATLIDVEDINP